MNTGTATFSVDLLNSLVSELIARHDELKQKLDSALKENVELKEKLKNSDNENSVEDDEKSKVMQNQIDQLIQQVDKCINSL